MFSDMIHELLRAVSMISYEWTIILGFFLDPIRAWLDQSGL